MMAIPDEYDGDIRALVDRSTMAGFNSTGPRIRHPARRTKCWLAESYLPSITAEFAFRLQHGGGLVCTAIGDGVKLGIQFTSSKASFFARMMIAAWMGP